MESGGRTSDESVPRWQIVDNLTVGLVGLLVVAFFSIISKVVGIAAEVTRVPISDGSWNLSLYLISFGMLVASTASVIISCTLNLHYGRKPKGFKFVCVILANRFAAIVCAMNAICSAINLRCSIATGSPMWSYLAHTAELFLTVTESALSLLISYICLKCYDLKRRQVALAFLHIGGWLLTLIVYFTLSTTSLKIEWPITVFFAVLGMLGVYHAYHPRTCTRVVYVIAALITQLLIFATTFYCIILLSNPSSSICILNMNCSHLQAGFCGLCLFLTIDEFAAILMTLNETFIKDPHNIETIGLDNYSQYEDCYSLHGHMNRATLERQESLPPRYEEIYPVSGASGEEVNFIREAPSLERQESLPPQYKDVINDL